MKRIALSLLILLLVATPLCYAQARNPSVATVGVEGLTVLSSLALTGLDVNGNPGYIQMTPALDSRYDKSAAGSSDLIHTYILWIDNVGDLCISSHPTISEYSSFPTGNWVDGVNHNLSCIKVGTQD